jgi:hypothetical protein
MRIAAATVQWLGSEGADAGDVVVDDSPADE